MPCAKVTSVLCRASWVADHLWRVSVQRWQLTFASLQVLAELHAFYLDLLFQLLGPAG